ncbi:hypothetical protein MKX03_035630, partial [Papaver bracteatum]
IFLFPSLEIIKLYKAAHVEHRYQLLKLLIMVYQMFLVLCTVCSTAYMPYRDTVGLCIFLGRISEICYLTV